MPHLIAIYARAQITIIISSPSSWPSSPSSSLLYAKQAPAQDHRAVWHCLLRKAFVKIGGTFVLANACGIEVLQAYLRLSRAESTGVPSLARCLGRSAARGNFSSLCQGWHAPPSRSAGIRCGIGGYVAALRFYTTIIGVLVVRASAKRKHKIQALYLEAARNGVPAKFYGGFGSTTLVNHFGFLPRLSGFR